MITLRSGKEVEKAASKNKVMIDDDKVVEVEANGGSDKVDVSSKNDVEGAKKGKKDDAKPPKDDEPKVDLKTLPFPQRFIRRNLDKQFDKFLNYLRKSPSPYHLWMPLETCQHRVSF